MVNLNDFIILFSLGLTVVFLCYCIEIGFLWWDSFKTSLNPPNKASDYLAQGIWVGFLANFCDNLYWGVTWALVLFKHDLGTLMMAAGSAANIIFRQGGGLVAAIGHVKAANIMHSERPTIKHSATYWVAGVTFFIILMIVKGLDNVS